MAIAINDPMEKCSSLGQQFQDCYNLQKKLKKKISKMPESKEKKGLENWLKLQERNMDLIRIRMQEAINNF